MKTLLKIIISALVITVATYRTHAEDLSKSVVQIIVNHQQFSQFQPWKKTQPGKRHGYGVVVNGSHVLTTESLVRNHTLIELRRAGSGEKITAKVELSDYQANLAILSIVDNSKKNKWMTPLSIAQDIPSNAEVEIIQFDETSQIQRGKADAIKVAVQQLSGDSFSSLVFKLLTDINVNGTGAAVIHKGKLAGIIINYSSSSRTGNMLPCYTIKRFIEDAANHKYKGFASAGFSWSRLVDPVKRSYLNVGENGGVLVLACLPGTGAGETLKPNDVILKWDGHTIDNLGFYEDKKFGTLSFPYLINGRRKPGDVVPVKIVRDKKEINVNVHLRHHNDENSLIPENITGSQDSYIIEGGLIIRELTGRYLRSHRGNWRQSADIRLVNYYLTQKSNPEKIGDRIVILSSVLPDPINIGYQNYRSAVITHLNSDPVRNISDVFRIFDRDGSIHHITLKSIDVDLVLDKDQLGEANKRLSQHYRVPSLQHRAE